MLSFDYGLEVIPAPEVSAGVLDASLAPAPLLYAELALDPATGDLAVPPAIIRGASAVVQRLMVRMRFFLGDWFLDERLGVPYFRDVFKKNPDPIVINALFRRVIQSTPGVDRVVKIHTRVDRALRRGYLTFEAILEDGTTIRTAEPFIVS